MGVFRAVGSLWKHISAIGVENDAITENEKRRLTLLNQITMIFAISLTLRGVWQGFDRGLEVALAYFATVAMLSLSLFFNWLRWYHVSKMLFIVICASAVFVITVFVLDNGSELGSVVAYLGTTLIPFLFYNYASWPFILFGVSLNVIGFILTFVLSLTFPHNLPISALGDVFTINDSSRLFWWSIVFICVVLTVRLFYVSNTRAEAKLRKTNDELKAAEAELQRELELAGGVQKNLLPKLTHTIANFEVSVEYRPAAALAGDMYDMIVFDERRLGILVADVVGHGVSAALVSMMVKLSMASHARPDVGPGDVLQAMNDQLHPHMPPGDFLTAFYAVLDLNTMMISYSNAGHPSTYLFRKESNDIQALASNAPLVGPLAGLSYPTHHVQLQSTDRLLFYTDGLTEEKNKEGIEFGEEKLKKLLLETYTMKGSTVQSRLLNELHLFKDGHPYSDDITMVLVDIGIQDKT